mgnify:CR=1 FL=1
MPLLCDQIPQGLFKTAKFGPDAANIPYILSPQGFTDLRAPALLSIFIINPIPAAQRDR